MRQIRYPAHSIKKRPAGHGGSEDAYSINNIRYTYELIKIGYILYFVDGHVVFYVPFEHTQLRIHKRYEFTIVVPKIRRTIYYIPTPRRVTYQSIYRWQNKIIFILPGLIFLLIRETYIYHKKKKNQKPVRVPTGCSLARLWCRDARARCNSRFQ